MQRAVVAFEASVLVIQVHVAHGDVLGQLELFFDLVMVPFGRLGGETHHETYCQVGVKLRVPLRSAPGR